MAAADLLDPRIEAGGEALGISRSQLYYKIQKHGIEAATAPAAPRA